MRAHITSAWLHDPGIGNLRRHLHDTRAAAQVDAVKTFWSQFAANVMTHRTHEQGTVLVPVCHRWSGVDQSAVSMTLLQPSQQSSHTCSGSEHRRDADAAVAPARTDYFFPWLATRMPQLAKLERQGSGDDHCWHHCEDSVGLMYPVPCPKAQAAPYWQCSLARIIMHVHWQRRPTQSWTLRTVGQGAHVAACGARTFLSCSGRAELELVSWRSL